MLGASIVVVLTAAIVGAQPTETPDDAELLAEIEALVGNVYDQKMARQFGTLELPRAEVQARLDTFGRWLDATRRGAFPKSTRLPEGLVETYEKTRAALSEAGQAPSAEQLDAVLLFLEEHTDALQKASGLEIELPM